MNTLPETVPSVVLPSEIAGGVLDLPIESEGGTVSGRLVGLMRLAQPVREEVETWHEEFAALAFPVRDGLVALARKHGCSYSTARRRYDQWRHNGKTALALAPAAPLARAGDGPGPEFGQWFHDMCLQHNRSSRAAYREFVARFRRGDLIPGLEHVLNRRLLPRGFSMENLQRFAPTEFERAAARIGRRAAAEFRPLVYTTRAQMQVGHQYQVDDMWHDFKVVLLGQPQPMRLLALHALDVFSGCLFAHAEKPRLFDEATGRSVNLSEDDFLYFFTYLLCRWGYHPEGTLVLGELGTARLGGEDAAVVADVTGGKVRFEGGKVDRRPSFGGFAATAKGNFRLKAHLESLHNLAHNETANRLDWPGQTGSVSRVNEPEGLASRERHQRMLLRATAALPVEVAQAIRHDFVECNQAVLALAHVWERINSRTEHDLEGWEDAGLTAVEWVCEHGLVSAGDYAAMAEAKQAWVRNTHQPRARKLSPAEVWQRGRLIRLRPEQAARILARVRGREAKVGRNHLIEFEDREIGPGIHRFAGAHFAPGDKFRCVVNPYWPQEAHIFGPRGQWLGAVARVGSVDRLDAEALEQTRRERSADEARLIAPVARAGLAESRARMDAAEHNAAVIETHQEGQRAEAADGREALRNVRAQDAVLEDPDE